jgi:hypothetical protein
MAVSYVAATVVAVALVEAVILGLVLPRLHVVHRPGRRPLHGLWDLQTS